MAIVLNPLSLKIKAQKDRNQIKQDKNKKSRKDDALRRRSLETNETDKWKSINKNKRIGLETASGKRLGRHFYQIVNV